MDARQGLKEATHYIEQVQAILTRHVQPEGPGERDTLDAMLALLDNETIVTRQRQWREVLSAHPHLRIVDPD